MEYKELDKNTLKWIAELIGYRFTGEADDRQKYVDEITDSSHIMTTAEAFEAQRKQGRLDELVELYHMLESQIKGEKEI